MIELKKSEIAHIHGGFLSCTERLCWFVLAAYLWCQAKPAKKIDTDQHVSASSGVPCYDANGQLIAHMGPHHSFEFNRLYNNK